MIITKLQMREKLGMGRLIIQPRITVNKMTELGFKGQPAQVPMKMPSYLTRSVEERAPPDSLWLAWLVPSKKHSKQLIQAPSYL